ncbi:MAG TPA: 2Fe-2S iron-sulfur cluster-binding protein [Candidatus Limnocylindrales bacterium]|nr:2Fe-2S iron-sulfur cluster-binding protein [Candidatus Limnocylindrales bacterium]
MTARRLPAPLHPGVERGSLVRIRFDGRTIRAPEGEPLAVSLFAAGIPILSRSFRFHRPRGLMCADGQCGWCECEVDGRPSVRTCRVPVRDGLRAGGEHALPAVRRDLLGLLDLGSRWIPPTFYHHRFLRPRRLRKRYLDVLRWFGGRGRLRVDHGRAIPRPRPVERLATDVLVVGGGPAGILAALGAADAGARVLLLEAEPRLGSTWAWREPFHRDLLTLKEALAASGVDVRTSTTAIGVYRTTVTALGPETQLEIEARTVVAATGAREALPLVPGNDLPGVMGARTVEWLVRRHGVVPGERAVLVGAGAAGMQAETALEAAGSRIVSRLEAGAIARILGSTAVRGVRPTQGPTIAADLVVVADRSPALELPLAAGATLEWSPTGLRPAAEPDGRTSVPWLWVAGSAAGRGSTDADPEAARAVGRAAAAGPVAVEALTSTSSGALRSAAPPGQPGRRGAMVCFCEDVRVDELDAELRSGTTHPELLKRRTGALTGPCQGKLCLSAFAACVAAGTDDAVAPPTSRPPLRPVRLGDLVAEDAG